MRLLDHIGQANAVDRVYQFPGNNIFSDRLVAVFTATFANGIIQMKVNRAFGDAKDLGNFPRGFAFTDPEQTLFFPRG